VVAAGLLTADAERQTASGLPASASTAASPSELARVIADTPWGWGDANATIRSGKDGWIDHPGWKRRGLATSWKAIDGHTVLLPIEEGRRVDRYAILVFNTDFTEYSAYDFHGGNKLMGCKRVEETAARTSRATAAVQPDGTSYPWVVFGRVTDSLGRGIAGERIVLPNQPRRVDFVMLPAASISGRVVTADGRPASGRRFYVRADKLLPAATVFGEFRPDETGRFQIAGFPCQSYWRGPADGDLAGVRSHPLAIPTAGRYDIEVSVNDADRELTVRIITAAAPSAGG
jgi:hypothetical protein